MRDPKQGIQACNHSKVTSTSPESSPCGRSPTSLLRPPPFGIPRGDGDSSPPPRPPAPSSPDRRGTPGVLSQRERRRAAMRPPQPLPPRAPLPPEAWPLLGWRLRARFTARVGKLFWVFDPSRLLFSRGRNSPRRRKAIEFLDLGFISV